MPRINNNRFSALPLISKRASSWMQPHKHTTALKTGDIVPIYVDEILPGDVFKMTENKAFVRMTTPIFPVMDNAYIDIYYFFVPSRLVYDLFPSFLGANDEEYGIQETEYFLPTVNNIGYGNGDIGEYMGLPKKKIGSNEKINTLPFRAYAKIINEYFRDENLTPSYEVKKTYEDFNYEDNETSLSEVSKLQYGKGIAKASKLHDLFTSALPFTQKGPGVSFNFNEELPLKLIDNSKTDLIKISDSFNQDDSKLILKKSGDYSYVGANSNFIFRTGNAFSGNDTYGVNLVKDYSDTVQNREAADLYLRGLGTENNISFSVNDLRTAFQMQRFYELLARSGTRYNEFIKGVFGVDINDKTVQRPQLLGSKRFTLNMGQVVQTSATDNTSPQGNVSGISATLCNNDNAFSQSFEENGYIIGLAVIRTNHTYSDRIPKLFSKRRKFDLYYPVFACIGEQPILNKEVHYSNDYEKDNKVFGYQEAWYEYRYFPSMVTNEFTLGGAYESWTYTDYYDSTPVLSDNFIKEPEENVERTLAVKNSMQFIIDVYFNINMTRLMPLYSIPGLIDHL